MTYEQLRFIHPDRPEGHVTTIVLFKCIKIKKHALKQRGNYHFECKGIY